METTNGKSLRSRASRLALGLTLGGILQVPLLAQEEAPLPSPLPADVSPPVSIPLAEPAESDKPLPINLPTAFQLAQGQPLDIAIAAERIQVAAAQLQRANLLWVPNLYLGADYFRHDGQLQDVAGQVFGVSKSTLMVGAGPTAVFAVTDAVYEPLAARQVLAARRAGLQAATNDTYLAVAESYFNVQQARGELAGAMDATRRAAEVARRAEELAPGLAPPLEAVRARTELYRRKQTVEVARERWRTASAELARILRLEPTAVVEPIEPPHLPVTLVPPQQTLDDLIPLALASRPELAAQQALVQATLQRLRQERMRPLVPSLVLRGVSSPPSTLGSLAGGVFGGGINDNLSKFSARSDFDVQVLWELQNLGLGNRARINERRGEYQVSLLEKLRVQDRVAAEVVQAHAQVVAATARMRDAEIEVRDAVDSANKNLEGMSQTKRLGGNVLLLVVRPQEVVAAIQALGQAYLDYFGSVADYNRAEFRLYRALGNPAQFLAQAVSSASPAPLQTEPASK